MYFDKVGSHPERLKNLYFAYTIVLKAFKIASDQILEYKFEIYLKDLIFPPRTLDRI